MESVPAFFGQIDETRSPSYPVQKYDVLRLFDLAQSKTLRTAPLFFAQGVFKNSLF